MDFTCILSLLPGGWGDLLWLGTLSVTPLPYCLVLQESLLVPPPLARGREWSPLCSCWGLCSVVACWCLLCDLLGKLTQLLWLLWCVANSCSIGIVRCKQGETAAYIFKCSCPCRFIWGCCILELLYIQMSWTIDLGILHFTTGVFCGYCGPGMFDFLHRGIFCSEYGPEMFKFYHGGIICTIYGPEMVGFVHRGHFVCWIWSWNVWILPWGHLLALIWSWNVDFLYVGGISVAEQSWKVKFEQGVFLFNCSWGSLTSNLCCGVTITVTLTYLLLLSRCEFLNVIWKLPVCWLELMEGILGKGFCHWEWLLLPLTPISYVWT